MARNSPENEEDFIRMQQEAIRRVRDMQERARSTLEGRSMPNETREPAQPPAAGAFPRPSPDSHGHSVTQSVWTAPAPRMASPPTGGQYFGQAAPPFAVPHEPQGHIPSQPQPAFSVFGRPQSFRAEQPPEETASLPEYPFPSFGSAPAPHSAPADTEPPRERSMLPPLLSNLLPSININFDSEQIMLLILILVLYQDKADHFLMLALVYVLLI